MAVLVGIDEAGFGPILGPLVVSSSVFSLPGHLIKADLWQVLKKSVAEKRKALAGRLLVADSKKAYSKSLGVGQMERTVLAFLRCTHKEPATLGELIETLCPDLLERLGTYPWHKEAGSCKILCAKADIAIASDVLRSDLSSNGMELLGLRSCCLDVAYYNSMVTAVKNKASVLFTAVSQLIKTAFDSFCDDELQVVIDRQGGRVHYRQQLQRMFANMDLRILEENTRVSSYQLEEKGRKMRLHFVVGADERFLPVSLASMVSKYLRELLIASMNRYFASFDACLKPTAGYWKDGLRFVRDLKTILPHIEFDSNQLIRCR